MPHSQESRIEEFKKLPSVVCDDMVGLWEGYSVASCHPLDGVLENLGWYGKRFTSDLRADALLFKLGGNGMISIDPALVPLRFFLSISYITKSSFVRKLFNLLVHFMKTSTSVASLRSAVLFGTESAAMVYDSQPIIDHFRRIDDRRVMGAMVISNDDRIYFFELNRVH